MSETLETDCLILKALDQQIKTTEHLKDPDDIKKIVGAIFYYPINLIRDTPLSEISSIDVKFSVKKGTVVSIDYEHTLKILFENLKCEILDDNVKKVKPSLIIKESPKASSIGLTSDEDSEDDDYEEFLEAIGNSSRNDFDFSTDVSESFELINLKDERRVVTSSTIENLTFQTINNIDHVLPEPGTATQTSSKSEVFEEKLSKIINQNDQIMKDQNKIGKNLDNLLSLLNEKALTSSQISLTSLTDLRTQDRFLTDNQDSILGSDNNPVSSIQRRERAQNVETVENGIEYYSYEQKYHNELVSRLKSRIPYDQSEKIRMIDLKKIYPEIITEIKMELQEYVPVGESESDYWKKALARIRKKRYRSISGELRRKKLPKNRNKNLNK